MLLWYSPNHPASLFEPPAQSTTISSSMHSEPHAPRVATSSWDQRSEPSRRRATPTPESPLNQHVVAETGLEPVLPKKADFESAASAIPPLGQERRVSNATRRCRQSPRQPTEAEPPPASGYLGDQRTPLSAT